MKTIFVQLCILFSATALISTKLIDDSWITEKHKGYNLVYTTADKNDVSAYNKLVKKGIKSVKSFFSFFL